MSCCNGAHNHEDLAGPIDLNIGKTKTCAAGAQVIGPLDDAYPKLLKSNCLGCTHDLMDVSRLIQFDDELPPLEEVPDLKDSITSVKPAEFETDYNAGLESLQTALEEAGVSAGEIAHMKSELALTGEWFADRQQHAALKMVLKSVNEAKKNHLQFKKLHDDAEWPTKGTKHSAGWDLYALEDTVVSPLSRTSVMVRTGIAVQLPPGTYGRIALRSGQSFREGATVTAGVIDEDYTDEVKVLIVPKVHYLTTDQLLDEIGGDRVVARRNLIGNLPKGVVSTSMNGEFLFVDLRGFTIKKGERFAQLVVEKIHDEPADRVTEFRRDYKKHAGFGSTGV